MQDAEVERQQRLQTMAATLGYTGSLHGEALLDGALAAKNRLGFAMLEMGSYLLLLKEGCAHGKFGSVLTQLGFEPDTARTYMAITRRLAKRASTPVLKELGVTKAAELLGLDDDQIDELAEAGATGELALDDVARMSVKELRAAVRKERREKERHQGVAQETATELAELKTAFKREKPAEQLLRLQKEATELGLEIQGLIAGALRQAVIGVGNLGEERGEHSAFLAGVVGGVQRQLTELRRQFDLPDASAAAAPSDVEAAESAAALSAGMAALRAAKARPAAQADEQAA
jgi:hypothetical protein